MSPVWILVLLPALAMADSFSDADKNKDSTLTDVEILNYAKQWDADKDGNIVQKEFSKLIKDLLPEYAAYSTAMFKACDSNKDQKLNAVDSAAVLKKIDTNKNGKAEKSEFYVWGSMLAVDALFA
ncbi:uncharacterized protein LOC131954939 [Physella acuta]|uniref:uncharacterized protein LOC131954939 n=1 Tax=Physella acuta TaxID=109671 RepID=UPI0027DB1CDA|nr:uncharacterized protein LOC131954939 [Physella acuta]